MKNDNVSVGVCSICDRDMVAGSSVNEHHWIPQAKGGKKGPKSLIHRICHDKIHSVWTEKELARQFNTPESIKGMEEMRDFLVFLKNKRADFYMHTKMNNRKR